MWSHNDTVCGGTGGDANQRETQRSNLFAQLAKVVAESSVSKRLT